MSHVLIERDAPISTWFHIGGRADRLARPESVHEVVACLELDDEFLVLGDGANLLVDDAGVDRLVVSLQTDGFKGVEVDRATGVVRAGAGVSLPSLINRCVRDGLGGLEVLAGIPATVGGAAIMNAGGAFGAMSDVVVGVSAMDRAGRVHEFERSQIDFGYRQSHLNHLIVTEVVFGLTPCDGEAIKEELNKCMAYKVGSQPMSEKSAGCVFKNPLLKEAIEGIGEFGDRVGAGLLIDRVGCKGLSVGGASVSDVHANFITTTPDAKASEVISLIGQVHERVRDVYGVDLEKELVIWTDQPGKGATS
ncbi:MAG: UDP-N-acetylmuramate dehydrogenase [Phycisphaerales bacterium]